MEKANDGKNKRTKNGKYQSKPAQVEREGQTRYKNL